MSHSKYRGVKPLVIASDKTELTVVDKMYDEEGQISSTLLLRRRNNSSSFDETKIPYRLSRCNFAKAVLAHLSLKIYPVFPVS